MPGPQPTPTKLKALQGNPGRRPLPKGEVQPNALVTKPEFIHGAAGIEWDRVINSMPPNFYTEADVPVLSAYCMAWVMYRNALAKIAKFGMEATGSKGNTVAAPMVGVAQKQVEIILKTADRLGMSPAARARLDLPENAPESKFKGLIGRTA